MEYEIEIYDEINKFSSYYDMMKVLPEYTLHQRDIKLNTLLEKKKVLFEIDRINSRDSYFYGKYIENTETDSLLSISTIQKSYDFKIQSMSFIIKDDSVLSLKCNINFINPDLESQINDGLKVSLRILTVNSKIGHFYLIKD